MVFFDYSKKDELARVLAEEPEMYHNGKKFLRGLENKEVLSLEQKKGLEEDLKFLEEANKIARESDYFVFEVEDGWTNDQGGSTGYEVYKNVNGKLVPILDIGFCESIPKEEEVLKLLDDRKIKKVYTKDLQTRKYLGLQGWEDDGEGFGRWYYSIKDVEDFNEKGIEVIVLE